METGVRAGAKIMWHACGKIATDEPASVCVFRTEPDCSVEPQRKQYVNIE
jgi:hypothetical protein